ncbi:hypothetical protein FRC96_08595 [Lujinxingia vulgaris]|uniref:Uncharacterized protein n=2 Tax=Lujinxingia vulgaris TaxID=2600176 RepID=A0A5C6X6F4_9DELT|nr:hypothetical protein FRC96_08595 [Lujinxingia vulgaris]
MSVDLQEEVVYYDVEPFYTHSGEIHSMTVMWDRSGLLFTADKPDHHWTHALYFVNAEGGEAVRLLDPIETDASSASLYVESSTGGLLDPIVLKVGQFSGGLSYNNSPLVYRAGEITVHTPACGWTSSIRVHPVTHEVVLHQRNCSLNPRSNHITYYPNLEFQNGVRILSELDSDMALLFVDGLSWTTAGKVLVSRRSGLVELDPQQPGHVYTYPGGAVGAFGTSVYGGEVLTEVDDNLVLVDYERNLRWTLQEGIDGFPPPVW